MYRLLIIDDEPLIVDWIYNLFLQTKEIDLDIYKAHSGLAALKILKKTKIDIVLTDIRMPKLNGLELLNEIRGSWPFCKVIFLTAYDNFEYVHEANKDGVTYLLKTEGDEEIIKAVKKAVCEINNQLEQEELIDKAKNYIESALPVMRREYLLELLEGENPSKTDQEQLDELKINLSINNDLLLLMGRCDDWFVSMQIKEKAKQSAIIQTIADKFLSPKLRYDFIQLENAVLIWIIQPKHVSSEVIDAALWEKEMIYLKGILDSIQNQCKKNLGTSISFVMDSRPSSWDELSDRFSSLVHLMIYDGIDSKEMVQTRQYVQNGGSDEEPDNYRRKVSFWLNKIHSLETYLESGQRKEFFKLFLEMRKNLSPIIGQHFSIDVEVYCSIVLMFLTYINHYGSFEEKLSLNPALHNLFSLNKPKNPDDTFDFFENIADSIFLYQQNDRRSKQNAMIAKLNEYIQNNLDKDLSLVSLADHVYLNPTYLSRIYKKITGMNISTFINNTRINEAKKMLKESNKKVQDVSNSVGFGSVIYFIRAFKENTGMTPHEYRES